MSHPVSPLAPKTYPTLPPIAGVRLATAEAGIRYKGRTDVLYVALEVGADAGDAVEKEGEAGEEEREKLGHAGARSRERRAGSRKENGGAEEGVGRVSPPCAPLLAPSFFGRGSRARKRRGRRSRRRSR